jgi:hypothetical protein
MSTTPLIGLNLPAYDQPNWNIPNNQNWNILDSAVGALQAGAGVAAPAGSWAKYVVLAATPTWYVNAVNAGALSGTGAVQQIPLFTTAARTVFHAILIKHSIAFSGGALSSIVVSLGIAATPDALMSVAGDTFDVLQIPSDYHFYLAGGARMLSAAATPIVLEITCVGGDPSSLATGTLEVDILASVLP